VLELRGPAPESAAALLTRMPEVRAIETFGDTLHLTVGNAAGALPVIRAALEREGVADVRLRPILPSLEDVFVALLRDQEPSHSRVGQSQTEYRP
jgi:hypothetical protein